MKIAALVLLGLLYVDLRVYAGDAVVVGYNADGVWTMVTYFASSSPKGGKDYKDAAEARKAALQDLRRRDRENIARTEVLSDSDATGYVAVARGKTESGKDVTIVGRGKSEGAAAEKAMNDLNAAGATSAQKIVYHYFSYGADSDAVKQ
ncbi:MAG: hypothetical protein QOI04_1176 [Verrucomicrobiota bacterium]|jgi:hypothetical protein